MHAGGAAADEAVNGGIDVDPMAALDAATGKKPAFVPAQQRTTVAEAVDATNADEIAIDEDDDE